jgi:hypothetical protein
MLKTFTLNSSDAGILANALKDGYLILRGSPKSTHAIAELWATFCRSQTPELPPIVVRLHKRYASIKMDLIGCSHLSPEQISDATDAIRAAGSAGAASDILTIIKDVPIDQAESLAQELIRIWRAR